MPTYLVSVREVHVAMRRVEANSPEEAKELAKENNGDEISLEYSHTLDDDLWTVEEENGPGRLKGSAVF